jgi:DNA invertase Pin-like site-specific DNA recombinase
MAEHYRLTIAEKTRDALARLRATGRRYTRILPYGCQATADGHLVPEPAEAAVVDQLRARVAAGESYRAIARTLAAAGVVNRAGRPFRFRALARMVARVPIGLLGHSGPPGVALER